MKKFAVVLSGCGVMDGSEIHEAVACMVALERAGVAYQCVAPNIQQTQVMNHLTNDKMNEERNVLIESARIARGNVQDINAVNTSDFAGAVYPGGYGAALNLCDFAIKGVEHQVQTDVLTFARAMAQANKPQGFACIAPVLIAKIYGPGVCMTIGTDPHMTETMTSMANDHHLANATDIVIDEKHKVVSTPAYMLAKNITDVFESIDKMIQAIVALS